MMLAARARGAPRALTRCATPVYAAVRAASTLPSMHMQAVSAKSQQAVELFDQAVKEYTSFNGDPVASLRAAVKADQSAGASSPIPVAHALDAALHLLSTSVPVEAAPVAKAIAPLRAAARQGQLTPRETAIALAVEALAAGHWRFACTLMEAQLTRSPTDIVVLRLLHDTLFFLGEQRGLRDSVARCVHRWDPTMPLYGRVAGMLAFGMEECNQYDRAEELGMTALNMDPLDTWAAHAVVHVYEMTSRREDAQRLLRELEDQWQAANLLDCHMHWHWALLRLEDGSAGYKAAVQRYDEAIGLQSRASVMNMLDATALLWRMELLHWHTALHPPLTQQGLAPPSAMRWPHQGVPGGRWLSQADKWVQYLTSFDAGDSAAIFAPHLNAYNDVNCAMGLVMGASVAKSGGDAVRHKRYSDGVEALLTGMRAQKQGAITAPIAADGVTPLWLQDAYAHLGLDKPDSASRAYVQDLLRAPPQYNPATSAASASVLPAATSTGLLVSAYVVDQRYATQLCGADLAAACVSFAQQDYKTALPLLMSTRPQWQQLGGSHAQRDVWEQTALHAAVGAGELDVAHALAGERVTVRPHSPQAWYVYASVCRRLGGPQAESRAMDAQNRAYMLGLGQGQM